MLRAPTLLAISAALAASLALAPQAQAAIPLGALPLAVVASSYAAQPACQSVTPAYGEVSSGVAPVAQNKISALLGGKVSQLELIRQQQAALNPSAGPAGAVTSVAAAGLAAPARTVTSGPCPSGLAAAGRTGLPQLPLSAAAVRTVAASPENFLASKRLQISRTGFDREWNRVRSGGLSSRATTAMLASAGEVSQLARLQAVNSWMNAKIRYVEDRELYGRSDYWASAGETLRRQAGDCEDIAIAKMQALAALGIARDAMYLTIVRDTVRAADHAVLVVRSEDKAWILDNNTDRLLDAGESHDYRPILSFSDSRKFIHGY
jgi:predicted transglutaminase-like cysteine proteinase